MNPIAKISRVLVGVDLDEASASALTMAGVLASAWDADITVSSIRRHWKRPPISPRIRSRRLKPNASRAAPARPPGSASSSRSMCGVPSAWWSKKVRRTTPWCEWRPTFDLIVVGTHRRHGARRWWLGSVAEAVVRRSPRPVLVVPAGAGVPDARRPITILAAGSDVGAGDAWADALSRTFAGNVVRSPDIYHCAPDRLQNTDLIVLSMPADSNTHFGAIAQVLKECVHPVLFVPSTDGIFERSPS